MKITLSRRILLFAIITLFFTLSVPLWAGGNKDKGSESSSKAQQEQASASPVYFTGDGGKGMRLAVLEPSGKGLPGSERWILSMIQSSITGDLQRYSAITIVDRQNLEKIIGEQMQSLSGLYSDDDLVRIGKLTNARLILAGSITKTSSTYMLEFAVTDAESGERKASYPPKAVSSVALENLSAVKEATTDLLKQLGVNLTEQGRQELNTTANTAHVQAETALAKGIAAQKQGTVVEALSYYIQATNYDAGLAEASSRMNILAADISSGNIGEDTRNDIAWRRQWVARLQEAETFFANSINGPQPYYIVYSTDIQKGKIDYQKETIDLSVWIGFFPDFAWSNQINGTISAVSNGLNATGRAQTWELNWPEKTISTPSPFFGYISKLTSTVVVEIINDQGKSIGKQTVETPYGFEIRNRAVFPLPEWEGNISFPAVNANLITDKLTIQVTSIDGVAAETASRQKRISVMPEAEWDATIQRNLAAQPQRPYPKNMVRIPGGTFMMGSPDNEPERNSNETQHQVTVSSFYMGKYEVTQKEYQEIMEFNPSHFKGDNLPVETLTWYDAVKYCNKRSEKEGLTPAYIINGINVTWNRSANGYRLPTEAEWEYACRAGTTTAYNTGASISNKTGWYKDNSNGTTHPVGQKSANAWGLYDMHGNVQEWCWDLYIYPSSMYIHRVHRGGYWGNPAKCLRSAYRSDTLSDYPSTTIGFRIVRP